MRECLLLSLVVVVVVVVVVAVVRHNCYTVFELIELEHKPLYCLNTHTHTQAHAHVLAHIRTHNKAFLRQLSGRHENAMLLLVSAIKLNNYFTCAFVCGWEGDALLCCFNADRIIGNKTTHTHTKLQPQLTQCRCCHFLCVFLFHHVLYARICWESVLYQHYSGSTSHANLI